MLPITNCNFYIATEPVDMRKSFNTLADHVQFYLGRNPLSGDAFVFIGKRRNRLKILFWEPSGYWLCNKRLEKGTFSRKLFINSPGKDLVITQSQWHNLLEGIDIISSKKLKRFKGIKNT